MRKDVEESFHFYVKKILHHFLFPLLLYRNTKLEYFGESGFSAIHRTSQHAKDIVAKNSKNALSKHIEIYHQDRVGDPSVFKFKAEQTFKKCLERQVTEGVKIANSSADNILNSKAEFHQPALSRVTVTRNLEEPQWVRGN